MTKKWFIPAPEQWPDQIIVPFCWESLAAWGEADAAGNDYFFSTRVYRNPLEVTRSNYRSAARHEVGWYRRSIRIPDNESWLGRRIILIVGAADFFTQAWCNGRDLGSNEEGFTPFEFDITDALERDGAGQMGGTIVLRVEDPMRNHDQPVVVYGYFGIRSFAAVAVEEASARGTLSLNGEPIYLSGALYQSYHPEGVYTAGDIESIQDDIACAKRAGFDLLRIHIKVDDPLVLYYADTIGILIMSDLPNFGEGGDTHVGRRRYET